MNQPAAYFALTDRAPEACSLRGYPHVMLYDTSGRLIPTRIRNGNAYQFNDPGTHEVIVQPAHSVYFGFGWVRMNPNGYSNGCVYIARLSALVPGGGDWLTTAAPFNNALFYPQSGAQVSAIGPRTAFTITSP